MRRLALIALLAAGCAGGPLEEGAPFTAPVLTEIAVSGGAESPAAIWAPEGAPRAVIVALHGFGDHGRSTFGRAAPYWAARGLAVVAPDHRGFGAHPNAPRWPGAGRLIEDAGAYVQAARARWPGAPVFLLGHSMGGGVALAAAAEGAEIDGLILAAPAVWGGDNLNILYRAAAWTGALTAPEKRWTGEGIVEIQASDNIEALRAMAADPLVFGAPSSREFLGLIRLMDRAVTGAADAPGPVLILYGEKDQVTPKAPVLSVAETLGDRADLRLYPEGWHLLFRDLQAETVWRDVADWIEERT